MCFLYLTAKRQLDASPDLPCMPRLGRFSIFETNVLSIPAKHFAALWSFSGGAVEISLRILFLSSSRVRQYVSYTLSFKFPHNRKTLSSAVASLTVLPSGIQTFYETRHSSWGVKSSTNSVQRPFWQHTSFTHWLNVKRRFCCFQRIYQVVYRPTLFIKTCHGLQNRNFLLRFQQSYMTWRCPKHTRFSIVYLTMHVVVVVLVFCFCCCLFLFMLFMLMVVFFFLFLLMFFFVLLFCFVFLFLLMFLFCYFCFVIFVYVLLFLLTFLFLLFLCCFCFCCFCWRFCFIVFVFVGVFDLSLVFLFVFLLTLFLLLMVM